MSYLIQPVVSSLTGTANQVTVSAPTGAVILSGPQDLATGSSPTFAALTLTGPAWTTYTPTLTPAAGTFTTASAEGSYYVLGKTVFITISITITTNGTAATGFTVTLPSTAKRNFSISVAEVSATGFAGRGIIQNPWTGIEIKKYDNTYLGGNAYVVVASGIYEVA